MLNRSTPTTPDKPQIKTPEEPQKSWWRYVPWSDKNIKGLDKGLYGAYVVMAFLAPISAVVSLILVNVVRKNNIHGTYKKAANFSIILLATLSFVVGLMRNIEW